MVCLNGTTKLTIMMPEFIKLRLMCGVRLHLLKTEPNVYKNQIEKKNTSPTWYV